MAKQDINTYNMRIDRTKTVMRLGRNGILYEYILPTYGNSFEYYNDAIDVKSHNKVTGRYQPIGDKRYFNFYQLNKMTQDELIDFIVAHYGDLLAWEVLSGG